MRIKELRIKIEKISKTILIIKFLIKKVMYRKKILVALNNVSCW